MVLKCWKTGKTCSPTRAIADEELKKINLYGTTAYLPNRRYPCGWCGTYHLTSRTTNRRGPVKKRR